MIIGVIGGNKVDTNAWLQAEHIGKFIAAGKHILVCGGLGGVMEAAAKGAKEKAGLTVGILPSDSKGAENPYIDVPIATGMSFGRNNIIINTADILFAIDGSYGTLTEIAMALNMKKHVIAINSWKLDNERLTDDFYHPVSDANEAVAVFRELNGGI